MDDLLAWLQKHGYARSSIVNHLQGVGELVRWLKRRPGWLAGMSQARLDSAYDHYHRRKPHVASTIHTVGRFLREKSIIPEGPLPPKSPTEIQLESFGIYLREMRGMVDLSVRGHLSRLRSFLRFLDFNKHPSAIRELRTDQIDAFLREMAKTNNRFSLQHVVASLRGFLRQQHARGVLKQPLHEQIDTPRTYRLEQLPRALPWEHVVALLRSIDRSQPEGLRDFTILYLATRYGLRCGELVRLTLDHVDWQTGILHIPQTKTKQTLQLPLTDEAGSVLERYLRDARPRSEYRHLFLRHRAPAGPLAHTAVHDILEDRIHRSGLEWPVSGTHVLRHSFAVHLLRRGVPMKHIGDVLGHRDCESTAVYLRLGMDDLQKVGLPMPKPANAACLKPEGWTKKLPRARTGKIRERLSEANFGSKLAGSFRNYLATRRALGRGFVIEGNILRRWDDFLQREYPAIREVLPVMFHRWAETMPDVTANVRRNHLRVVRNFLLFHARSHPKTYLPDTSTFPKPCPYQSPRLVTPDEMARILSTASSLPASSHNPLRAQTIRMALGLLFCCGLRRGELLRLQLRHFDPFEGVLRIEKTKFHKSRLVPLSASVARELRGYLKLREHNHLPVLPGSPLIWSSRRPTPADGYCAQALTSNWQQLCLAADVVDGKGRPPRIHDLRHSFAVAALHRWYKQGAEVQAKLPYLATYMGHVCAVSTHHYLHLTPDLRQAASHRFHRYAKEIFSRGGEE
jgi:site-specific recombinase XerD